MRQENKFVAELYRYLAPFIDTKKTIHLSLDGMAAKNGVNQGILDDADVPDFWFTLIGSGHQTLLEAKTLTKNNQVTLGSNQVSSWRAQGSGKHRPHAWVAVSLDFKTFYFWSHQDFLEHLNKLKILRKYNPFTIPDKVKNLQSFETVEELALHILRYFSPTQG